MSSFGVVLIIFFGSLLAGFLGSLSGLGGGLIIVPLLVLLLNVDIHYAIGASLIAVIATSSGAASAYIKDGFTNIRMGLFFETATTVGAIFGVFVGSSLPASALSMTFALVLLYCAFSSLYDNGVSHSSLPSDKLAIFLKLEGSYPSKSGEQNYGVHRVPLGYFIMFLAGTLSGILGIGSGALKVLALDKIMNIPFKTSTTTSNFMIGVTAAAGAGIYLKLGYIDPLLTMPTVLGVTLGAVFGAFFFPKIKTKILRYIFICLIIGVAIELILMSIKN